MKGGSVLPGLVVALAFGWPLHAQSTDPPSTVVIVTGDQATIPIPTLMEGSGGGLANIEMADHLFLHLANLGPEVNTSGDHGFMPSLAKSWTRRDSVTLAFDLDPRATWQDGVPVTARDVLFTFERARNPAIAPNLAGLLRNVVSVSAEGDRTVVFRYSHKYAEQLYDAVWYVAPIPAHLLERIPADKLRRSAFVTNPVGNGPYRWVRSVAGQFIELAANERFFLGRPGISRVLVRTAADPAARVNLVLSHEADAMDNILPPVDRIQQMRGDRDIRLIPVPSPTLGFMLFNQRDPADTARPHPILADPDVRRAIILSLDRSLIVRSAYGSYGEVPYGPASPILWIRHGAPRATGPNRSAARRILASRGWTDSDHDGVLDRNGVPLRLDLSFPTTSAARRQMALVAQQQLRQSGIDVVLQGYDFPVYFRRRLAGDFDIDFSSTTQDPSPSGLTQGWSCGGTTNVAHYCDPRVDSLIERAISSSDGAREAWHEVLRQVEEDAPAAFMYAPSYVFAVNRRLGNVAIHPESSWIGLWKWTVGAPASRHDAGQ
ncbi:MAG: ABC transporter substrate-binding protein [Gemmatimonadales bacterium]